MSRPVSNFSPAATRRRATVKAYRGRGDGCPFCPDCTGPKTPYAKRCRNCDKAQRLQGAAQDRLHIYHRMKSQESRARKHKHTGQRLPTSEVTRQPCRQRRTCLYSGYEHFHCACGLVLGPEEWACPMCIAEQARLEFKTWPKAEEAA